MTYEPEKAYIILVENGTPGKVPANGIFETPEDLENTSFFFNLFAYDKLTLKIDEAIQLFTLKKVDTQELEDFKNGVGNYG